MTPLLRYWACIVCSCHREAARPLQPLVMTLAGEDDNRLVRVRAAEFLSLIDAADPRPVIYDALRSTNSPIEAGLILNTVVMLRDGEAQVEFDIDKTMFQNLKLTKRDDAVQRRLEYLNGE
ncbi:MAG: hypothetical protein R3C05_11035 [Pirellulaceae bacterium]